MSATDDDWTAAPQGQPAPGSLRFHVPVGVLLPPQLTAQLCAVFAALCVALLTTVPHGTSTVSPAVAAAVGIPADAQPDPVTRDAATGRFAYEPATGTLPSAWWVRLSFDRGFPSTGAILGSLDGKVREARIEDDGSTPVIAIRLDARTDESVVATARRIAESFRQRPDASSVRLGFGVDGQAASETGIAYAVAGSGDEPTRR
ncbi:MAG: hypothetical protein Q7T55_05090 [Solirubrobacteraceae bacterium]|nr:hypothetical protein [Solirubrobacteraceae bacterium]